MVNLILNDRQRGAITHMRGASAPRKSHTRKNAPECREKKADARDRPGWIMDMVCRHARTFSNTVLSNDVHTRHT